MSARDIPEALLVARVVLKMDAEARQQSAAKCHGHVAYYIDDGDDRMAIDCQETRRSAAMHARESYEAWRTLQLHRYQLNAVAYGGAS